MTLALATVIALLAAGAWAAFSDWRYRRIPNSLVATLGVGGLAAGLVAGGWPQLGSHAGHLAIALVIGFVLSAFRVLGAGDSKYYAAAAGWFPLQLGMVLLSWVAVAGFVLALGWLLTRRRRSLDETRDPIFDKVPFGIAIAAGSITAALMVLT